MWIKSLGSTKDREQSDKMQNRLSWVMKSWHCLLSVIFIISFIVLILTIPFHSLVKDTLPPVRHLGSNFLKTFFCMTKVEESSSSSGNTLYIVIYQYLSIDINPWYFHICLLFGIMCSFEYSWNQSKTGRCFIQCSNTAKYTFSYCTNSKHWIF